MYEKNPERKNIFVFIGVLFVISLFFCFNMSASINASTHKTCATFLKIGIGARPCGMGEAFSALADGVDAINFNPAGLGWVLQPEIQATHGLWFADVNYDFLGYVHPTLIGTFGGGIQYLYMDKMHKIKEGVLMGKFSVYDGLGILSYGTCLGRKFSLGLSLKGLESKIDSERARAVASDIGMSFCTSREGNSFSMALVGQNLGSRIKFVEEEEYLPVNVKLGLAGTFSLPKQYSDINLAVDVNKPIDEDYNFCFGLEHWGANTLALRCGYKYDLEDNKLKEADPLSGWRLGVGIKCKGFLVDYAFVPYGGMGHTHRISLTSRFIGWGIRQVTSAEAMVLAKPLTFSPNGDKIKDKVSFTIMVSNLGKVKDWFFQIRDNNDNLVKEYKGKDKLPLKIMWRGTNESGYIVDDGRYKYVFQARGKERTKAESKEGWIVLDTVPPVLDWSVSPNLISPDEDGKDDTMVINFSTTQIQGIGKWQVDIMTREGKLVRSFKGEQLLPSTIIWDGKDDYYKKVVPNDRYNITVSVYDEAGNKTVSPPKEVEVNIPPRVETKEIKIKEEARGLRVNLSSNVLFGSGKSSLKKESYKALEEVLNLLNVYPDNKVAIEGHTDSVGSVSFNQKLSLKRAKAVYHYLINKGKGSIDPKRITVVGFGETKPIASNSTRQGRAQNRRVEIIVLKEQTD